MTISPNANWNAARDGDIQSPIYYVVFAGLTSHHFSTAPVKAAGTTKKTYLRTPRGAAASIDPLSGAFSYGSASFELLDVDGEVTDLIASAAPGAPVPSIKNRTVQIFQGFVGLDESDYVEVFCGKCRALRKTATGYDFKVTDPLALIDGQISTGASTDKPSTIVGNPVNVFVSYLTGSFLTTGDFPLVSVSTTTGTSSAPTGLGVPVAELDVDQIKAERDVWHVDDVIECKLDEPEDAREYFTEEFFRIFQAYPIPTGLGKLGVRYWTPALPATAAVEISESSNIVAVRSWEADFASHLNAFEIRGDYDLEDDEFDTALYALTDARDTTNQNNVGETIHYRGESKWLKTAYNGVEIATELAGRLRLRYLTPPARLQLDVTFRARHVEVGDVVSVTHSQLPDLQTGTLGITDRLMTVVGIRPRYQTGLITLTVLDTNLRRYGVIAPATQVAYLSASAIERDSYGFISDGADEKMSNDDPGYYSI